MSRIILFAKPCVSSFLRVSIYILRKNLREFEAFEKCGIMELFFFRLCTICLFNLYNTFYECKRYFFLFSFFFSGKDFAYLGKIQKLYIYEHFFRWLSNRTSICYILRAWPTNVGLLTIMRKNADFNQPLTRQYRQNHKTQMNPRVTIVISIMNWQGLSLERVLCLEDTSVSSRTKDSLSCLYNQPVTTVMDRDLANILLLLQSIES